MFAFEYLIKISGVENVNFRLNYSSVKVDENHNLIFKLNPRIIIFAKMFNLNLFSVINLPLTFNFRLHIDVFLFFYSYILFITYYKIIFFRLKINFFFFWVEGGFWPLRPSRTTNFPPSPFVFKYFSPVGSWVCCFNFSPL